MVAALNSQTWWWVSRSSGMVAWALITAGIVWGLTLSSKLIRRKGIPAWLLDLHRYLGTLSVVFVGVHMLGLFLDNFAHFTPKELFVPMASNWKPGPTAWGIVGMYLLVAIQITSWLMRKMPRKVWHAIHLSSFGLFIAATVHGALSGTDKKNLIVQWLALTGVILVVFLVVFRLSAPKKTSAKDRSQMVDRLQAHSAARKAEVRDERHERHQPTRERIPADARAQAAAARERIPADARAQAAAARERIPADARAQAAAARPRIPPDTRDLVAAARAQAAAEHHRVSDVKSIEWGPPTEPPAKTLPPPNKQ